MSKGKFYLIISAVLYGIAPILASIAYTGGINGITLTFIRSFAALPLILIIIVADKRRLRITKNTIMKITILGTIGGSLPVLLLYLSYGYISSGLATTLHFIYPVVTVIAAAVIYREKIPRIILSSVVFVTVGIFMFSDVNARSDKTGIILALFSGLFYSFYVIYLDRSGLDRMDYVVLTFYTMLIMSISVFIFGVITGSLSFDFSPLSLSVAVVISLMTTLGAMPLFQVGVRLEGASEAGILSTMEPVTSVILGAIFLGERINSGQIMGVSMIIFGVILAERAGRKRESPALH